MLTPLALSTDDCLRDLFVRKNRFAPSGSNSSIFLSVFHLC
jgi:hypothetical protein